MDEIKLAGTIELLDSIYDVEPVPGIEGAVAPLLWGDAMSSHLIDMPPGFYAPHSHPFDLTILCVRGEAELLQGSVRYPVKSNCLLRAPKDEDIGFEVKGPDLFTILVFVAPRRWTREEFYGHIKKHARQED